MKKIIATVIIVLAVMFTPQGVYADSEEQNNEYYDRLISEINEGLSFEGDEDVKTVLEDNNITLEDPSSAANINAFDVIKHIFESFTAALRSPLIMLGKITAATMLCVLVRSMSAEGTGIHAHMCSYHSACYKRYCHRQSLFCKDFHGTNEQLYDVLHTHIFKRGDSRR